MCIVILEYIKLRVITISKILIFHFVTPVLHKENCINITLSIVYYQLKVRNLHLN